MSELYEGSADRRYGSAPAASVLVRLTETGQRLETVHDPEYVRLERLLERADLEWIWSRYWSGAIRNVPKQLPMVPP